MAVFDIRYHLTTVEQCLNDSLARQEEIAGRQRKDNRVISVNLRERLRKLCEDDVPRVQNSLAQLEKEADHVCWPGSSRLDKLPSSAVSVADESVLEFGRHALRERELANCYGRSATGLTAGEHDIDDRKTTKPNEGDSLTHGNEIEGHKAMQNDCLISKKTITKALHRRLPRNLRSKLSLEEASSLYQKLWGLMAPKNLKLSTEDLINMLGAPVTTDHLHALRGLNVLRILPTIDKWALAELNQRKSN
uniref:Uncharacterized protein n=1 Tax=Compsopogon caeruleus TaxID=31354 RepID=A0A6T6DHH9_9RHOD|mmetsp:Transcript_9693/g.19781  ORF Transcript_9693/g.19781 Transcript_9693/m.19781 type:complete len:249 (+) Transcript_9693:133-879(+)